MKHAMVRATAVLAVCCASAWGQGPDRSQVVDFLSRGSALRIWDISGDGRVTDWDAAMILFDRLQAIGPVDRDRDGHLTVEDQILTIEAIFYTSFGDLNADGQADLDDVAEALARIQALDPLGDVNGDGSIDALDALLVMEMEDPEVYRRLRPVREMAECMSIRVEDIRAEGREAVLAQWAGDPRINDHLKSISRLYPCDHRRSVSRKYPDNHFYEITRSWDGEMPPHGRHTVATSRDDLWPPNHTFYYSIQWKEGLTPEHRRNRSEQWKDLPNHRYQVSITWPENHARAISQVWPPNHTYDHSMRSIYPPEHEQQASLWWTHGLELSHRKYPSNHDNWLSLTWGPHSTALSMTWPPNHTAQVSSGWPPGVIPAWWPPNHFKTTSAEWDRPMYPLPPMFPPDHSVFTTIRDIIPQPPRQPQ